MNRDADPAPRIRIQIVRALPASYWATSVLLPPVSTVADALALAEQVIATAGVCVDMASLAIFGRSVGPRTRLHDGDRIELLRPLLVSPRDSRTSRASASRKR